MPKHILFLCSRNKLRSPTAEAIFSGHPGIAVDSAGLASDATVPLSADQVEWADVILVMERKHLQLLKRKFGPALRGKQVAVLGIPDDYDCMAPALITLLQARCAPYLP